MGERCWFSTMRIWAKTSFLQSQSGSMSYARAVQILHRVVEKRQLFYLVFADPVPEGIAADA